MLKVLIIVLGLISVALAIPFLLLTFSGCQIGFSQSWLCRFERWFNWDVFLPVFYGLVLIWPVLGLFFLSRKFFRRKGGE